MKNYINTFHLLLKKIDFWEDISENKKNDLLRSLLNYSGDIAYLTEYFEKYRLFLIKSSLNLFIKSVIKTVL